LHCQNNSYYTGYTNDMDKRYQAHCEGRGSKYTRSFKPLRIAHCWMVDGDKSLAMQVERAIKKLSRAEKDVLIANPDQIARFLEIQ